MGRPRHDEKALAMHELYLSGQSLAQVGEHFGVTRQTVYETFRRRGFALRSKTFKPSVTFNGETYSADPDGYWRKTFGDRRWLHHAVWEHHNGPIPKGSHIHHIDGDTANNDSSNLACISPSLHMQIHNPMRDVPVKHCLWCGEQLVRKVSGGQLETPAAVSRRLYCGQPCADNHKRGKPKGWRPRDEAASPGALLRGGR